jgi:hypothetical protein
MRFFRAEIEMVIKMLGILTLIGLIALPMAWGYEQRKQARAWQTVACSYRMREVTRRTPVVSAVDYAQEPCVTLERLGLDLDVMTR